MQSQAYKNSENELYHRIYLKIYEYTTCGLKGLLVDHKVLD